MAENIDPHIDLGGYVLGVLEPEEAAAFEAHLAACGECRREVDEFRDIPALLEQAAPALDVPAHLEERTFSAIERAAEESPAPATAPAPRGQRRRRREHPRQRRTIELRRVAVVAAAVLVVGAGSVVVRETSRPTPAAAQVIELTAPGGGVARAVARVRATDTGGVIEMDVEGLTPPPPGSFFECWLVAAEGDSIERPRRVSVGTFSVDEDGRATVRWDFSADVATFPRMGITVEPDDGNPVHTTARVLAGTRLLSPIRK